MKKKTVTLEQLEHAGKKKAAAIEKINDEYSKIYDAYIQQGCPHPLSHHRVRYEDWAELYHRSCGICGKHLSPPRIIWRK